VLSLTDAAQSKDGGKSDSEDLDGSGAPVVGPSSTPKAAVRARKASNTSSLPKKASKYKGEWIHLPLGACPPERCCHVAPL